MKLISIFLLLLIIKSSISNISIDDYSKDKLINRLKSQDLFEIILLIKKFYDPKLSIISCEELNKDGYGICKRLIKEYMPSFAQKKIFKPSYSLLKPKDKWDKLKEILSTKFSPEETKLLADRIIKRVEQLQKQKQEQRKEKEKEKEKEEEKEKEKEEEKEEEREKEKESVQIK